MGIRSLVVRYVARRAVPFIQLYALYVLGHGEDGPGGGFQGGVIFAAALVLLGLTEGWLFGRRFAPERATDILLPMGCLIYAGIGVACMIAGGLFLEYGALAGDGGASAQKAAHHFGLIGIEFGVMVTVSAAMVTLFFEMTRPPELRPEDPHARPGAGDV